jgi:phosphopantothenoylcysteine decarboxylase / phosphopantothenate---cysteine ligase
MLSGKRVLLAVTGSIAAYKACDLVQRLKDQGCEVRVAMTPEAAQLVHPNSFAALTGHAVLLDAWSGVADGRMDHIAWARWAEVLFIVPASAQVIAQMAHGLADNVVALLALAFAGPVLVAPAMNTVMLHHPAVQANLATLKSRGVVVLPSGEGVLACGETGEGKLLEVASLVAHLRTSLVHRDVPALKGKRVLLSLGHTQEPIDAVRFISNRSSGKTGLALARALWRAGAEVEGVAGIIDQPVATDWQALTQVQTSAQFAEALLTKAISADVIVMAAAIADFTPASPKIGKSKDSKSLQNLELKPSLHILSEIGRMKRADQVLVGFALETDNLLEEAERKMQARKCDLVVVNNPVDRDAHHAGQGFGHDAVLAGIMGQGGMVVPLGLMEKEDLAMQVLLAIDALLSQWEAA